MTPQEYVTKLKAEKAELEKKLTVLCNFNSTGRDKALDRLSEVNLEIRLNDSEAI